MVVEEKLEPSTNTWAWQLIPMNEETSALIFHAVEIWGNAWTKRALGYSKKNNANIVKRLTRMRRSIPRIRLLMLIAKLTEWGWELPYGDGEE